MSPSHPLSDPQREVWRLQRLLPESCLWNIGGVIHIEGGLDRERFSEAAREIVDREEAHYQSGSLPVRGSGRDQTVVDRRVDHVIQLLVGVNGCFYIPRVPVGRPKWWGR